MLEHRPHLPGRSRRKAGPCSPRQRLCFSVGFGPKAIECHERSLAIHEKLGRLGDQANTLAMLGLIAAEHGTPEQARGYLSRALDLVLGMGLSDDHPLAALASEALAELR